MTNNDILRQLRYTFDYSDEQMMSLFEAGGITASRAEVCDWLKKEEEEDFVKIVDVEMATFLNGFIIDKRGKKEGPPMQPEKQLNNNIIFRKLKIALNLKDDDIIHILDLANMRISKHELSSFFRKPTQRQYRKCNDQFLRNFLHGLQLKFRDKLNQPKDVLKRKSK
ncbi:DUF1456 domain-containing protein [Brumimicrobium salinarum]|uniref:DUF1456 domain-containing protein n=1 Tax=Brumimicrobium salinarum TaxID=2058658 RepID=A0A2I0R4V4_9FLAO|nr:DUF1456 family protein [Brumimicrobium salinarum]PKR81607.1 DUF1456 domain-containing protein [Brumimicrobium salinarum]